jgi:hypothetical protein
MPRFFIRTFAIVLLGLLLAAHATPYTADLPYRASRFVSYLESSRGARDTEGPLTLWERIVYSYIYAAG